MNSEAQALFDFADAVAEGRPIDWTAAEASGAHALSGVIRELAVLAAIGQSTHRASTVETLAIPRTSWGRFESLVEIGAGAYGRVYRAWDPALERHVAVKLLNDEGESEALVREARLLARIRHPHVVTVHGVDRVDDQVGLWMEFVEGRTLKQDVLARGPLPAREAVLAGIDLCRGLAAVHAAGLLHRDIKAQNVMRDPSGRVVLMDFGAGDHRDQSAAVAPLRERGTPFYLAPELFAGAPSSVRSDIYSLGVLLFHLLSGAFPVEGATLDDLREGHRLGRQRRIADVRPDVPRALAAIVDRAIDADPARRYGTAGEFAQALEGALEAVSAEPLRTRLNVRAWAAAAALLVALAGLAAWRLRQPDTPAGVPVVRSIAVLPFRNLSGNANEDYLAEGMTELLTADLSQYSALRVTSRTSLERFHNTQESLPAIGKALNVDALVEGSVMRVGDRVRVTARVIGVSVDQPLWTRSYERKTTDLFALQGEVSSAITGAINISFTPGEPHQAVAPRPIDPEAQEAYLRGQYLLSRFTAESVQQALGYFQTAVAKAPAYGRGRAALARCYILLEFFGLMPLPQAYDAAFQEASRAVEVEPDNAEAHGELADVLLYRRDWRAAGREYELAVTLNHSNTLSRSHYSRYLSAMERHDEAILQARAAVDLDPFSPEALNSVPLALYYARRYDEAVAAWTKVLGQFPASAETHFGLGRSLAAAGRVAEAEAEIRTALRLADSPAPYMGELARLLIQAHRQDEGLAVAEQVRTSGKHLSNPASGFISAALGERDTAFRTLTAAVSDGSSNLLWARVDPRLDPLRDDPRFALLLEQLGLTR